MGRVFAHFLDSGAASLHWTEVPRWSKKTGRPEIEYYDTEHFWNYMAAYVEFVKRYQVGIDYCANIDVIGNAELSWRNQKWLEKHGLNPVPIIHVGEDVKWLHKYLDLEYPYIGIGGNTHKPWGNRWIDKYFDIICDTPSGLPKTKVHGFGITAFRQVTRWPWFSCDSTSWTLTAAYGSILIPKKRGGKWSFDHPPLSVCVSSRQAGQPDTFSTMGEVSKSIVEEWLEFIQVPMGKDDEENTGVVNDHSFRRMACLIYFEMLRKSLPEWPWPFRARRLRKGLFR